MKKIIYSLLFCTAVIGFFTACDDDNEVFDRSAAQRLKDAQEKVLKALQNENGWVMQYYSDTASYGGFTLWAKFDARNVTVAGESAIAGRHETVTSQYTMKGDRGPVLSFSTYNKLFHLFSDPQGDGSGMLGDYEFMVLETAEDHILMQGKKRGALIRMTPLPEGETYDSYLTKIDQMNDNLLSASTFKWDVFLTPEGEQPQVGDTLHVNNSKIRNMKISYYYTLTEENSNIEALWGTHEVEEEFVPYIVTLDGLKFYSPRKVGKTTLTGFNWDAEKKAFVAEGQTMKPLPLSPLHYFYQSEDSWIIDEDAEMSDAFKNAWLAFKNEMMNRLGSDRYFAGFSSAYILGAHRTLLYFPAVKGGQGLLVLDCNLSEPDKISFKMSEEQFSNEAIETWNSVPEFRQFVSKLQQLTNLRISADNPAKPSSFTFARKKRGGSDEAQFTLELAGGHSLFEWPEMD